MMNEMFNFSKVLVRLLLPNETLSLLFKMERAWVEIMFALDLYENELCRYMSLRCHENNFCVDTVPHNVFTVAQAVCAAAMTPRGLASSPCSSIKLKSFTDYFIFNQVTPISK